MPDYDSLLSRLYSMNEELLQAGNGGDAAPDLFQRLHALANDLKSAADETMEELRKEAQDLAARMEAKAEERRKAREAPKPAPPPGPWEDHQGLEPDQIEELIKALLHSALARK